MTPKAQDNTRIEWRYLEDPVTPGPPPASQPAQPGTETETETGVHPKAAGIDRIRVSLHRPADRTGNILAVWDDDQEAAVGSAFRAEGGSPLGQRWQAVLWAAHPSLAVGHVTWKRTVRELGDCLTGSDRQ